MSNAHYDELFRDNRPLVEAVCLAKGIERANLDDSVQWIFLRFLERDMLTLFSSTYRSQHHDYKASESAFLVGFARKYVLTARDRQYVIRRKEVPIPITLNQVSVISPPLISEDLATTIQHTIDYLETLPVRGKRDLRKLFVLMVEQVITIGHHDRHELAARIGVSTTAIYNQVKDLREAVAQMPPPRLREDLLA